MIHLLTKLTNTSQPMYTTQPTISTTLSNVFNTRDTKTLNTTSNTLTITLTTPNLCPLTNQLLNNLLYL